MRKAVKDNPKKFVRGCALPKEIKVHKSDCPAVKNVRRIRTALNTLVRESALLEGEALTEANAKIDELRTSLKEAKYGTVKPKQCEKCHIRKALQKAEVKAEA